VGWRDRIYRLLDRGKPPAPLDGDELVELTVLSLPEAAYLTAELRGRGLHARYFEYSNLVTRSLTSGRVVVPRRELAEARAAYDEWRRTT
jgi:hypothetical protein